MGNKNLTFQPIQRDLLYTKIADAIVQYIKDNNLKSGDKIPSERMLAQEFNTSRNSVREALRVLERGHVIRVEMGKGAFITSEETEASFYLKLWRVNYMELLEIKGLLELHIIDKLCGNMTPDQIRSLEEPLMKMEEAAAMGSYLQNEDFIFHSRMRKIAGNSTMEQMLDTLVRSLDQCGTVAPMKMELWRETVPYHRAMLNAMVLNRPFAAQEAYRKILQIDKNALELRQKINQANEKNKQ